MENKIFRKSISVDRVFYGFDPEIGLHFYFHYKPFPGLRRAKRERKKTELPIHPKPIAPQHRRCHLDRTTTKIAPQTNCTPPRSHHHRRLIHPKSISSAPSLPMTDLVSISSPMTDLVAHDPWPISPFPSIFDHSLFLPLLVWPNCEL